MRRRIIIILLSASVLALVYYSMSASGRAIVMTGVVTTDELIVSPEVQGRLQELLVQEGDLVTNGALLAVIRPQELRSEMAFFQNSERQSEAHVAQAEAELQFAETQTRTQVAQAEAEFEAARAQVAQSTADLESARLTFERSDALHKQGVESAQAYDQSRTTLDAAKARLESLRGQAQAAQAAVELAKTGAAQVGARRAALAANQHQLAAAGAQTEKAKVRLDYTELRSPINGIVDTRVAFQGEVVEPGRAILTLIDPDALWVRADVEEGAIDRIPLGAKLRVRFASGLEREGVVFYRRVDADYATQRDVSRTKRDVKTFEIRLRCDNADRALAVGMTAYVTVPAQ